MKKCLIIFLLAITCFDLSAQTYKGETRNKTASEKLNEQYCSGLFRSAEGTIIDMSVNNVGGYRNILEWLDSRVAGLQVITSRSGQLIPLIRGSVPGIYVDENPVSVSYLNMMSINDIVLIKIIRTAFLGGFNGGNGAIAIYTQGDEEEEESADSK